MKTNCTNYLWVLLLTLGVWSCSTQDPEPQGPETAPTTFVEATKKITWSSGDLKGFANQSSLGLETDDIQYDASIYRVVYRTTYKEDSISASALVIIPETENPVPTFSYQHGTIASNAEAPTNLALNDIQLLLLSMLSGTGMVVVVPDYIGFGESVEIMHPYYVEDLTSTAIVNAIYASKQLAERNSLTLSSNLYLAGYSQGGYATMAAHKFFEEQGMTFYDLKASFPASGGYDIKAFQRYFFSLDTYDNPFFLAYVANAYKVSYDWDQSLSLLFKEPYATNIPSYFDGSYSSSQINGFLTTNLTDLLSENVVRDIDTETYQFLNDAFDENSLTEWVPTIRMFMYHGDADITVPYQNSVDVYNNFITNGASAEVVTFTTIEGGTHYTGAGPWIVSFIAELDKLKSDE